MLAPIRPRPTIPSCMLSLLDRVLESSAASAQPPRLRAIPSPQHLGITLVAERAERSGAQGQTGAKGHRLRQPPRRQHPQDVPVGEHDHIPTRLPRPAEHAISPRLDLPGRLAARAAIAPQEPAWPLLSDLRRCQTLILAVLPLVKVVAQDRRLAA